MKAPTIGIRQADGSFYGIMEDNGTPRKRLVLSAARSDQHSVRIDLLRSTDARVEDAALVGSLDLMSDDPAQFADITFDIAIDEDNQLSATATLPNGESSSVDLDLSEFRSENRSDSDILSDASFDGDELDTLDDTFSVDELGDDLGDLPTDGDELGMDFPEAAEPDPLDDLAPPAPAAASASDDEFSMDDLDAGFGLDEAEAPAAAPPATPEAEDDDSWHDFSMDDMEPMEFLDTGDQISAPKSQPTPPADDFSMDDDAPLDLSEGDGLGDLEDFSEDLGSGLPELGAGNPSASDDGLDDDFLPPLELSDDEAYAGISQPDKPTKAGKTEKALKSGSKPEKAPKSKAAPPASGTIDKTALVLSLVLLSLLVVSLVILLFLNLLRPPQAPVIQPEVLQWRSGVGVADAVSDTPPPGTIDLGSPSAPEFAASSVLEVPAALTAARVALTLAPGDTVADATRRFGSPERVEGTQLSW